MVTQQKILLMSFCALMILTAHPQHQLGPELPILPLCLYVNVPVYTCTMHVYLQIKDVSRVCNIVTDNAITALIY